MGGNQIATRARARSCGVGMKKEATATRARQRNPPERMAVWSVRLAWKHDGDKGTTGSPRGNEKGLAVLVSLFPLEIQRPNKMTLYIALKPCLSTEPKQTQP